MFRRRIVVVACLMAAVSGGCRRHTNVAPPSGPIVVNVSQPIAREVTDYEDFTGRTDAVYSLDVRARVTGYLTKMPFKEGFEVKKNDLLFEIDPRPYKAQLDRAQGDVLLNEAKLKLAKADNARAKKIAETPGAISQQDLDKYQASQEEADAAVRAAKANLEAYKLNLDFCQVTSPIDGVVSRYYLTLGNLVNQDSTLLTTVMSTDPMYVYFEIDERTVLRVKRMIAEGKFKPISPDSSDLIVWVGLANETGFPHKGFINFVNNKVDPNTGTITVRGVLSNPRIGGTARMLAPGLFVRVRLPIGPAHHALLVAESALATDQGLKFVYVVGDDNVVQYRRVQVGPLQDDGLRVIEDGLQPEDWVVTSGLQLIRAKQEVTPERGPMPIAVPAVAARGKAPVSVDAKPRSEGKDK
jgi:multidrug efflux system membrane fusion protein